MSSDEAPAEILKSPDSNTGFIVWSSSKTVDYRICQSLKLLREYLKDYLPQKGR